MDGTGATRWPAASRSSPGRKAQSAHQTWRCGPANARRPASVIKPGWRLNYVSDCGAGFEPAAFRMSLPICLQTARRGQAPFWRNRPPVLGMVCGTRQGSVWTPSLPPSSRARPASCANDDQTDTSARFVDTVRTYFHGFLDPLRSEIAAVSRRLLARPVGFEPTTHSLEVPGFSNDINGRLA